MEADEAASDPAVARRRDPARRAAVRPYGHPAKPAFPIRKSTGSRDSQSCLTVDTVLRQEKSMICPTAVQGSISA